MNKENFDAIINKVEELNYGAPDKELGTFFSSPFDKTMFFDDVLDGLRYARRKSEEGFSMKWFKQILPSISDKKLVIILGAVLNEHKRRAKERKEEIEE